MKAGNRSHQEGAALFVAVLILALMGAMGIMAFNTVLVDRQVAGFQNHSNTAFYAAEAAAARGRSVLRDVGSRSDLPNMPAGTLGDAAAWPIQGLIRHFRPELERRILDRKTNSVSAPMAAE